MKVAITSLGDSPDALLDEKFGRCSWFVIYDTETRGIEFIPNPNKDKVEGAGPAAVQLIAGKGAKKVISGEFGAKVKSIFDQLRIQLIILNDTNKKIRDVINLLNHQN